MKIKIGEPAQRFFLTNKVLERWGAARPRESHPGCLVIMGQRQDRPATKRGRKFVPGHRKEELPRGTCCRAGGAAPRRGRLPGPATVPGQPLGTLHSTKSFSKESLS